MMNIISLLTGGFKTFQQNFSDPEPAEITKIKLEQQRLFNEYEATQLNFYKQIDDSQTKINQQLFAGQKLFFAGWRPAIGWVCVVAFAYNTLIYPIFSQFLSHIPVHQFENMTELLFGMLGLGGLRTFEKMKNIQQNH